MGTTVDLTALETDFVAVAKPYAQRKGISYEAWREAGVPAATLKAAGIGRGKRLTASHNDSAPKVAGTGVRPRASAAAAGRRPSRAARSTPARGGA